MRAEQRRGIGVVGARFSPANFAVGKGAVMAVRVSEMLTRLGNAIEFILGQVFRQPVAAVLGEIQFPGHRAPVKTHRVAYAARVNFCAAAIPIHTADLRVGVRWLADVARRANIDVELVVRPDADVTLCVRLVGQIVVDHHGFGWIVEK